MKTLTNQLRAILATMLMLITTLPALAQDFEVNTCDLVHIILEADKIVLPHPRQLYDPLMEESLLAGLFDCLQDQPQAGIYIKV